jgi:hypothetical protein
VRDAAYVHERLGVLPGVAAAGDVSLVRQMVAVAVPPEVTEDGFLERGIEVPVARWRGWNVLRVSVAPYTARADLDRLVDCLRDDIERRYQSSGSRL